LTDKERGKPEQFGKPLFVFQKHIQCIEALAIMQGLLFALRTHRESPEQPREVKGVIYTLTT